MSKQIRDLENDTREVTNHQDHVGNTQKIHEKQIELEDRSQKNNLQFEVLYFLFDINIKGHRVVTPLEMSFKL